METRLGNSLGDPRDPAPTEEKMVSTSDSKLLSPRPPHCLPPGCSCWLKNALFPFLKYPASDLTMRCEEQSLRIDTGLARAVLFLCSLSLLAVSHLPVSHCTWGFDFRLRITDYLGQRVLQTCWGQWGPKLAACICSL